MHDEILEHLHRARYAAAHEPQSREVAIVITKVDEAILWRQYALQVAHSEDTASAAR